LQRKGKTAIDHLLDGMYGTRFVYVIFSTPDPLDVLRNSLARTLSASEQLDRVMLQTGTQANTHRVSRRALKLLEILATRLDEGSSRGMWRTSILFGTSREEATHLGLSILLGCFQNRADQCLIPVRMHHLRPVRSGYPVHVNRFLSDELATLCALPTREWTGFQIRRRAIFDVDHSALNPERSVSLGRIKIGERTSGQDFFLSVDSLTQHALAVGITGYGKTNTVKRLLLKLADLRVPFLVMEPAKSEYLLLADKIRSLLFFRIGSTLKDSEIPFQFNPFAFPIGFPLHTHIDFLKSTFVASFGLFPPTPFLLEAALLRIYEQCGWQMATGTHPHPDSKLSYPSMSDLLAAIDPVVDECGYDLELTRNMKGALKTRIGNLCSGPKGMMLDTRENIPDEVLFQNPVVLEMKDLGSDQEKALIMGFVLTRLYEYRDVQSDAGNVDGLQHLLVVEEAHRLLKRTAEKSSEEINMQGQAVETFTNMLSEIRAYGQGVMVVEQIPSKLSIEVVKNSATKIVHRLGAKDDRDLVGDTMNLNKEQKRNLTILEKGDVVVHGDRMDGAISVHINRTPPFRKLGDREIAAMIERALPERLPRRLVARVSRRLYSAVLDDKHVLKMAEGCLIRFITGVEPEAGIADLQERLSHLLIATAGIKREGPSSGDLLRIAIFYALVHRALWYKWTDTVLSSLLKSWRLGLSSFAGALVNLLKQGHGSLPSCTSCDIACLFSYEANKVASTSWCMDDLRDTLVEEEGEDLYMQIDARIMDWIEIEFDFPCEAPMPLRRCILVHGLFRLGFGKRKVDRYVAEYCHRVGGGS